MQVCVLITEVPITKLFAGGGSREDLNPIDNACDARTSGPEMCVSVCAPYETVAGLSLRAIMAIP
jgi:hypothetical protein